ncbi:hypothetical protein ABBQ38_013913 [Trebouxia sp. C0009 RCD-2024]
MLTRLAPMDPPLRGLTVWAQAGTNQQHDPHKHAMSQAGDTDIDEEEDDQDADIDDHAKGGHDIEHDEDEAPGDDELSPDDDMGDATMDDEAADEASDMSMDPSGQSGYPADPGEEEEEKYGQTPCEPVDLTVSPAGKAARSEVISVSGGSSDDGSENVGAHSVEPEGSINMHTAGATFLAAVKRQSKVKEGDWLEVRQQSNSGDYGVIDIG